MLLIGYDIGSSSVKAALVDGHTGKSLGLVNYPETEMTMISENEGWAEQHPEDWWEYVQKATDKLLTVTGRSAKDVAAIGVSYQMHGLVVLDKLGEVIRPSIIWCDSRAVKIGDQAFEALGKDQCLQHLLNSPGNFTASKLKWVKDNEPEKYALIDKVMLPGDYIAYKLTGELTTTTAGLSEGIFWDFVNDEISQDVIDYYGFRRELFPEIKPVFSIQGNITKEISEKLGFSTDTVVSYRAGDQPNNAFSLNVLEPGEVAATAGTSGVVYGISDHLKFDPECRINSFAHVNHTAEQNRVGVLLCINGAGSAYGWLRNQLSANSTYPELEEKAQSVNVGSDGLSYLPFGNGAERMLGNKVIGAHMHNLQFNRHSFNHMVRACLEGIAFSFVYGIDCMKHTGITPGVIKAGDDNMFQSDVFSKTISTLTGTTIKLKHTSGAVGAALGAGYGAGFYHSLDEAFMDDPVVKVYEPDLGKIDRYKKAYEQWLSFLKPKN